MSRILDVKARQVFDSRGNPTVEAELKTKKGVFRAIVPSGASTGTHEALELRDGEKAFGGKAVTKAVSNVNKIIAPKVKGLDVLGQKELDKLMIELDGTKTKSKLGANAILSVSMAACCAAAADSELPLYEYLGKISGRKGVTLPAPQLNVMNGGKHAGLEEDIQEQMLWPVKANSFAEAFQMGIETYHALQKILKKKFGAQGTLLGDEGGFVPPVKSVQERLDLMLEAVKTAGYEGKIDFALDPASSEFFSDGKYRLYGKEYSPGELVDFYAELVSGYPISSLEDGMAEEDWEGWAELTAKIGSKVQIVGDDLLVTNPERIKRAIKEKSCNALLLKVNQIGTVTESIEAANVSFKSSWGVVVSHRSGETEDSFNADLVVGLGTGQSKFGAPARTDRNAKYNELLRIEEMLGKKAKFGLQK